MLTKVQLAEIKKLLEAGVSQMVIAIKYDLERQDVRELNQRFKKESYAAS